MTILKTIIFLSNISAKDFIITFVFSKSKDFVQMIKKLDDKDIKCRLRLFSIHRILFVHSINYLIRESIEF